MFYFIKTNSASAIARVYFGKHKKIGNSSSRLLKLIPGFFKPAGLWYSVFLAVPRLGGFFQGDADGDAEEGVGEEERGDKGVGEGIGEGVDCSDFLRLTKAS